MVFTPVTWSTSILGTVTEMYVTSMRDNWLMKKYMGVWRADGETEAKKGLQVQLYAMDGDSETFARGLTLAALRADGSWPSPTPTDPPLHAPTYFPPHHLYFIRMLHTTILKRWMAHRPFSEAMPIFGLSPVCQTLAELSDVSLLTDVGDSGLHPPGAVRQEEVAGFLYVIISLIFFIALVANGVMIFLIGTDSQLHTPMYFLLSHLSFIDMMYISTIVPKMLFDYLLGQRTISFDRYTAVCNPLHYPVLLSQRVCWGIIAGSWLGGSLDGFLLTPITMSFPFCASWEINHFFCEALMVLQLACADTALYETVMYVCCVVMLLIPFSVVIASYAQILTTVHRMSSAEGRQKAFATCSSHMMVVTLFYGAAMYTYMLPHSYYKPNQDKVFSVFFTILTPMLNPLTYSL
ncbi:Olfactory Receptor 2T1 [Manis pentadactyla]|nr:Olfactory Receptor 2T1 [Manis pentadactyla]